MHTRTMGRAVAGAAAAVLLAGTAQAALVLQGNGVEVLDTDTNLLWLYEWNSLSGITFWSDAGTWAAGLTVGGATAGSWRLPEIGEYADLWINPAVGGQLAGLQRNFNNVQANRYWSATEEGPTDPAQVMAFDTRDGSEVFWGRLNGASSVAVRAVPEPQTYALMLLGLGAGALLVRRRRL